MSALLTLENIETFYGPIQALKGISMTVREGDFVCLLGANGAGKSTTLKTISGVLSPTRGRVVLRDTDITHNLPDQIARRGVAHVPEGREVFAFLTVHENLMMGAYARTDRDAVARDFEQVYSYFPVLKERAEQRAFLLSGGQQQMLAIARGLLARPQIMLLDEPSLGLSPLLVQEIFSILTRLHGENGVTLLLVEQNAQVALNAAQRGYVLELGRIVMDASSAELIACDDIREFYLGQGDSAGLAEKRFKRKKTWR